MHVCLQDFADENPYYKPVMNLLMLILIFLGLVVAMTVFYIAWRLSSGRTAPPGNEEPGAGKESKQSPGSSEHP